MGGSVEVEAQGEADEWLRVLGVQKTVKRLAWPLGQRQFPPKALEL